MGASPYAAFMSSLSGREIYRELNHKVSRLLPSPAGRGSVRDRHRRLEQEPDLQEDFTVGEMTNNGERKKEKGL